MMNICIPDVRNAGKFFNPKTVEKWNSIWEEFKSSSAGGMTNDLYLSSRAIYASIALAPLWCFIFIAIMSAFAETIAWICVALAQIGFIAGAVVAWLYRQKMSETFKNETATLKVTGEGSTDADRYVYG